MRLRKNSNAIVYFLFIYTIWGFTAKILTFITCNKTKPCGNGVESQCCQFSTCCAAPPANICQLHKHLNNKFATTYLKFKRCLLVSVSYIIQNSPNKTLTTILNIFIVLCQIKILRCL